MPILPDDLLQIAKDLMQNAPEEVNYRSAANRGYYAAFHAAHQLAPRADNYQPPTKSTKMTMLGHMDLINLLKNHAKKTQHHQRGSLDRALITMGIRLSQAYALRLKADYRNSKNDFFSYPQAKDSINHVQEVVRLCQLASKWKKP